MAIALESIIPLGRRKAEYLAMFDFTGKDLDRSILDCGGGPSSFNYEMLLDNRRVTSIDPVYEFSAAQVQQRIDATFDDMMKQAEDNQEMFVWDSIKSIEELKELRMTAMNMFIQDFEAGKKTGRYVEGALPVLPFGDSSFDLALSSHFLFLYSETLSYEFHEESLREMLRVADEVRVFPVVDLNCNESPYLARIIETFKKEGFEANVDETSYEFQRGASKLLRITRR